MIVPGTRRKEHSIRCALVRKVANVLRTLSIGIAEVQLLDLSGPRHGREHLEGILTVDLGAADAELQESAKRLEVFELT